MCTSTCYRPYCCSMSMWCCPYSQGYLLPPPPHHDPLADRPLPHVKMQPVLLLSPPVAIQPFFCYRAWRKCSVTHCWWLLWAATHCCCLGCQNPNCCAPWLPLPSPLWRNLWPKWITLAIASVLPPFQSVGYWPPAVSVMHQNLAPSSSGSSLAYFSSDECLEFFRLQFCADCSGPDQVWNLVHCCISLQTLAIEATSVTVLSFCFFLGNPDRGWNDPPKLAFNPAGIGAPTGSGRHRLLNKRVPIPLNPQDTSSSSPLPPTLK